MNVHPLAVLMLAARQAVARDNPDLTAANRERWNAWLETERRRDFATPGRQLVVCAEITCLNDLYLHVGLLQLLAVPNLRSRVLLMLPTEAAARMVRAQAYREGWGGLVQILAREHAINLVKSLDGGVHVAIFAFPTVLPDHAISVVADLPALPGHSVYSDRHMFIGPAHSYPEWSNARAKAKQSFAGTLALLGGYVWKLPEPEEDAPSTAPMERGNSSHVSSVLDDLGRVKLPDLNPDGEIAVWQLDGSEPTVIARQWSDLAIRDRAARVRVPPQMLTPQPHQVRVDWQSESEKGSTTLSVHVPPSRIKPWMISAYLNRGGGGNTLIRAFAEGVGCRLAYAEDEPGTLHDIPVVWGVLRDSDRIIAQAKAQGLYFYYIDHAYFDRGHGKSYRITRNGYDAGPVRACPADRLSSLEVEVLPWRMGGAEIIVCPPTEYFMKAHGCPDWLETTMTTLRASTDRPIVIREKPQPGTEAVSLQQALQNAHALVTHSSNVAIEAVCLGTPVFVSPASAAAPIGRTELSEIESPVYPDREPWLAHLAYNQFSLEEIRNGRAWRLLLELEERQFV